MTRLFLRFYATVLLILLTAWFIQGYVFRQRAGQHNVRVVEQAMAGGVRSARDRIASASESKLTGVLEQLRADFEFPVELYDLQGGSFTEAERSRLANFNEVVLFNHDGLRVGTLVEGSRVVALGPLPSFVGPSELEIVTGLGIILAIAAAAIALALRPVARQLLEVERTATAIAEGNLSARINSQSVPKGQKIATAFNSMADRTEDLLRTQRELLQAVSHDLRTPLARMRFAIDLIGLAETDEEREPRLASLDAATEELSDLVGELLNYVRLETADSRSRVKDVSLYELLQRLVAKRSAMYSDLTVEIDCPADAIIKADENGLQRAVGNLLANACRFAKSTVRISVDQKTHETNIDIEDDGDGIPESERKRVLNPFVRLSNNGKNAGGSGLGLALVNRIVKAHGGEVRIENSSFLGGCLIRTVWNNQLENPDDPVTSQGS